MNTCSGVRSSRPARLFSFGLLDGLQVRLRRPHVLAASADFRLERLATAFMNNPGLNITQRRSAKCAMESCEDTTEVIKYQR
jgi:hypothetical protein